MTFLPLAEAGMENPILGQKNLGRRTLGPVRLEINILPSSDLQPLATVFISLVL